MNFLNQIPSLNETNFEGFLKTNLKNIFVYETEDYEHNYYFPSHLKITGNCKIEKKWARQC